MGKITKSEEERIKDQEANDAHNKAHADRVEKLKAETIKKLGPEMIETLGKYPMAIAAGGIKAVVQNACNACAGHPEPLEAAVRTVRVMCGLKGTAPQVKPEKAIKPAKATKSTEQTEPEGTEA